MEIKRSFSFDDDFLARVAVKQEAKKICQRVVARDWKNGEFYFLFRKYFLGKYMLMEEEAVSDDINELTRISIEKLSSLDKKLIKNVEEAASCDGASSVITKKALFYMVMQKEFGIQADPALLTSAKTIVQLAEIVEAYLK